MYLPLRYTRVTFVVAGRIAFRAPVSAARPFAISGTSNTTISGYLSASSLFVSFVCEETEGEATSSVGRHAVEYPDYLAPDYSKIDFLVD